MKLDVFNHIFPVLPRQHAISQALNVPTGNVFVRLWQVITRNLVHVLSATQST